MGDEGIIAGPKARLDALGRGVEKVWGMTFEEYAQLCVDDPEAAEEIAQIAVEKLKEKEALVWKKGTV